MMARLNSVRKNVRQLGFTLLELVIVVVIIGILAAVAIPQFFNLAGKADENAVKAVAANLASAAAMNYGACKLDPTVGGTTGCKSVASCGAVGTLVTPSISDTIVTGAAYVISGAATTDPGTCTVAKVVGTTASSITAPFPYPGKAP